MVYIHGGSLVYGYGSQYQPDYILDKPVVLVTFNYRLGLLGIQINIAYFEYGITIIINLFFKFYFKRIY